MTQSPQELNRLRKHPSERFAPPAKVFDLTTVHRTLVGEAHGGHDGHRQVSLIKKKGVTLVYFAFEVGGEMPLHAADGVVTIHVLDGELEVTTPGEVHVLTADTVLVLDSGIEHAVHARQASRMLLTVSLDEQRLPTETEH